MARQMIAPDEMRPKMMRKWYENGTLRLQLEQMSPIRWLLPLSGIQLVEHHKEPGRKHDVGAVA